MMQLDGETERRLEQSEPAEIVAWALARFADRRLVLTTAFGMEGCALIDMVARHGVPVRVVWVDTAFLFPETHRLRHRMEARYPHLRFERRSPALTPEEQAARHGPELWSRDRDACCRIRKVDPVGEVLAAADVWLTGLTRSQAPSREGLRVVEWDPRYEVVKVSPLAAWSRERVWNYVREHEVPFNELHARGYPSVGCTHCTRPVPDAPLGTYSRAGRWPGSHKLECGLHLDTREHLLRST